jgi:hypothetical protein
MNEIIREKKKRFIKKLALIILIPLTLCAVFGIVDYFRIIIGKKPIFIYRTENVSSFDFEVGATGYIPLSSEKDSNNVGIGQNAIVFEDVVSPSKEGATYYGIGYNVSTCDNETGNYTFQLGGKQKEPCFSTLTCTKTLAENNKQSIEYFFFDGKVYRMHTTITMPAEEIVNEEVYKKELIEINDIEGCGVTLSKPNDKTYVTKQMCNISNMSNNDVKKVYLASKKSMAKTRTEIIDKYSHDEDMICE